VAAAPAANTVAVLYFDNRSRDSNDAYLADGLTEAIITKLGDLPRLTVKSRFVVGRYRSAAAQADPAAIARSLGVTYLVTGSVQRAGSRLRVTAEMARAASGDRVWGQQYERGDGDVFAIQEDIARGVATGVAGRLLPAEAAGLAARPTRNNEAYDHLLRGDLLLAQRTLTGTLRALAEYGAAVALDPRLASGWAKIGLADALRLDWGWGDGSLPPDSVLTNGLAAADRALALDSLSSDGWMARGYLLSFRYPRDFAGAAEGLRRAVALNPRNAEAWQQLGDLLGLKSAGHPGVTASSRRSLPTCVVPWKSNRAGQRRCANSPASCPSGPPDWRWWTASSPLIRHPRSPGWTAPGCWRLWATRRPRARVSARRKDSSIRDSVPLVS